MKKAKKIIRKTENSRMLGDRLQKEMMEKERDKEDKKDGVIDNEQSVIDDFESQIQMGDNASKELFSSKNIRYKSEITAEQRGALSILYDTYQEFLIYGIDVKALKTVLDEYIDFGVPVDRKRVTEFVDANKLYNQNQQGMNRNNQQGNDMQNIKL